MDNLMDGSNERSVPEDFRVEVSGSVRKNVPTNELSATSMKRSRFISFRLEFSMIERLTYTLTLYVIHTKVAGKVLSYQESER